MCQQWTLNNIIMGSKAIFNQRTGKADNEVKNES